MSVPPQVEKYCARCGKKFVAGPRRGRCDGCSVLTPREEEIAGLVARALGDREIAGVVGLTHQTVKVYVSMIMAKVGAWNRTALAVWKITGSLPEPFPNTSNNSVVE